MPAPRTMKDTLSLCPQGFVDVWNGHFVPLIKEEIASTAAVFYKALGSLQGLEIDKCVFDFIMALRQVDAADDEKDMWVRCFIKGFLTGQAVAGDLQGSFPDD